jgi:ABC-2 type transport system permease protein
MNKFWIVAKFTINAKLRAKSYLWMTIIFAVLITLAMNLPGIMGALGIGNTNTADDQFALVYGDHSEMVQEIEKLWAQTPNLPELTTYAELSDPALQAAREDKQIAGMLIIQPPLKGSGSDFPAFLYQGSNTTPDTAINATLSSIVRTLQTEYVLAGLDISDAQLAAVAQPVALGYEQVDLTSADQGEERDIRPADMMVVFAFMMLFFFSLFTSAQGVATEVTQEKSSRVMEILITSVSTQAQMFGKVIGIMIVSVVQLIIFIAVACANLLIPGTIEQLQAFNIDFTQVNPMLIVVGLAFYIFGYLVYAMLYAAVGSIVSRTEELPQACAPLSVISIVGFYIASFNLAVPDSLLMQVCSYIPIFSPFTILIRYGVGNAPLWEVGISLAIVIVTSLLLSWLAAKIYRIGVMMYGKRPSWSAVLKAIRAS